MLIKDPHQLSDFIKEVVIHANDLVANLTPPPSSNSYAAEIACHAAIVSSLFFNKVIPATVMEQKNQNPALDNKLIDELTDETEKCVRQIELNCKLLVDKKLALHVSLVWVGIFSTYSKELDKLGVDIDLANFGHVEMIKVPNQFLP